MRNFLAFVGLIVVGFVGVGYYMGWYKFDLSPGKEGKQHLNVEFDTKKIGTDVEKKFDQGLSKISRRNPCLAAPSSSAHRNRKSNRPSAEDTP